MLIFMPGLLAYFLYYPLVKYLQNQAIIIHHKLPLKSMHSNINFSLLTNKRFQYTVIIDRFVSEYRSAKCGFTHPSQHSQCAFALHTCNCVQIWDNVSNTYIPDICARIQNEILCSTIKVHKITLSTNPNTV